MKQEIKERVEKIRKGEVPEGYKKTKVGIIPEEWKIKEILQIADYVDYRGKTPQKTNNGIFLVTAKNIKKGFIDYDRSKEFVSENEYIDIMSRGLPKLGDVLITTEAPVGNVAQIDKENIALAQRVIKYRGKEDEIDNTYMKFYFLGFKFQKEILIESTGGTVQGIKGSRLHKLKVSFPKIKEQEKIAEILSTWDRAIEFKEKIIEEKKDFKRGLMQKLLTGELRFSEFTGDWAEIPLKNIVNRITTKNKENNKTVITISAKKGFVNQDEYFNKLVASKDLSGYFLIKKGDFAYNKSYSNGYPVGAIKRLDSFENAVVTTLYICFRIKDGEVSNNFLKYYFDSGLLNSQIKRIANEGGRAHGLLNVTPSDFFNIKVNLPKYEEQEKISATLLTNEQGIQLLEQDIFELKEQKRGLMQLLLTGIIRVEVD